jgi:tripartite-type tricarboxylate transporter receptor subunit TctC
MSVCRPSRPSLVALALAAVLAVSASAQAQTPFPSRPLTLIVPFAAGGPTDVVARIAAEAMAGTWAAGRDRERAGAGGTTWRAARRTGGAGRAYDPLWAARHHALSVTLYPRLAYDPVADFAPVGLVASAPQVLVVRKTACPSRPSASSRDYARANGERLNNGHAGVGATSHVACLLFNAMVKANPASVAYRGTAPALNDLVSGQIDYLCDQVTNVVAQANAGAVRPLAVMAPRRSPVLPDVPTSAEAGMPDLLAVVWNGIFLPKGTPPERVERLAAALSRALDDERTRRRLADIGAEVPDPPERGPGPFGDLVRTEVERWRPLLRAAGVTMP